jgi:hypothetical protein
VGARLTLQKALAQAAPESNGAAAAPDTEALARAEDFLHQCLGDDPNHVDALWCLAAVRWLRGNREELARQAAAMDRPEIRHAPFHFFAALCRLAAQDFAGVLDACARLAALEPSTAPGPASANGAASTSRLNWPGESAYLAGLAHLGLGDHAAAAQALTSPAGSRDSPSATHAQALLGSISLMGNDHEQAARWWQIVEPKRRFAWGLGETLAQTVFLTALEAYTHGSFEQAADKLRAAGKLGCRDRRLGALLVTSLFKAGQAMIYGPLTPTLLPVEERGRDAGYT